MIRPVLTSRNRAWLTLLAAVVLVGLWWLTQHGDTSADGTSRSDGTSQTDGSGRSHDSSGTVALSQLPPEAREVVQRIQQGGPFRYDKDGSVFRNAEGLLPDEPRGYYREYTVETPGSADRGARRIITGGVHNQLTMYYTEDHYRSFRRIEGTP